MGADEGTGVGLQRGSGTGASDLDMGLPTRLERKNVTKAALYEAVRRRLVVRRA